MLRDEHRMSLERSLLAVIARVRCSQPFWHEVGRIGEHGIQPLCSKVSQLPRAQPEAPAERRFCKIPEKLVDVFRGGPPSEQGHAWGADDDLILPELSLPEGEASRPGIDDFPIQKRSIPNMKSSATVTTADSSSDPRQPRRFEKKKNIAASPVLQKSDANAAASENPQHSWTVPALR
jgi:hypothetical protein